MPDLKSLGKYEIIEYLGGGGMAQVYKAHDPELKRFVAIKVIKQDFTSASDFRVRFEREAKIVAALDHIHILKLFDYGYEDGQIPYMVMPLITTGSLENRLANEQLNLEEVARLLNQLAAALDYAHQRDVIHRDLKPDNILLDESGNVLLADFGIAKLLNTSVEVLTETGIAMGTPYYMSPEQAHGASDIDWRSDVYSLGVLLYRMVTRQLPFYADSPLQVIAKHITEEPPPPSDKNPAISEAVERVILKALVKSPQDRYQSAGELAQAFQQALEGKAVSPVDTPLLTPLGTVKDKVKDHAVVRAETILLDEPPTETRPPALSLLRTHRLRTALALLLIIVLLAMGGRTMLIQNRISVGLHAATFAEAKAALDTASALGGDVAAPVEQELLEVLDDGEDSERAVLLAELYSVFADQDTITRLTASLEEELNASIEQAQSAQLEHRVRIIAVINPNYAANLAGVFNDQAVDRLAQASPQITQARLYLEAVRILDTITETNRTGAQKSVSLYNLAILIESDTSLLPSERLSQAEAVYREAIYWNNRNFEAIYRLSSMLTLQEEPDDLDYAIELASNGWQDVLDTRSPSPCHGAQDFADETVFQTSWYCFLLMTTEAAARHQRGDDMLTIETLLNQSISLAEANSGFGELYYTAEAYYFLALIQGTDVTTETLCTIIQERNRSSERHNEWARYATDQLAQRGEDCR